MKVEDRLRKVEERFGDEEVPTPDFWGGWRVIPKQAGVLSGGKQSRLHDRVRYLRVDEASSNPPR